MTTDADDSIRPFEVSVGRDEIDDLRTRLERTRWPDQLPETGWADGTEREFLRDLCAYWRAEFDWAAFEDRCNEFDQYVTTIDGQRLHFYHVRSPESDATPLVLSHGWPGSVTEFLDVLGPLTDPAAHGGDPADAFHVVAPSLPGFGFSGPTGERGYDVPRIADVVADLMARLGYDRYVAQGGDWGALVAALLGANYPDRVDAIHTNMLFLNPSSLEADDPTDLLDEQGLADYQETAAFRETETAYHEIQATKPRSLAYGLTDSPAGLAGWIVEKFRAWSDCDGDLESWIDRDRLLDNLSVYWLTGTIGSSMRLYAETDVGAATPDSVDVPTGHARYPAEVYKTPRGWAEAVYDVEYWSEQPEGGHFAAMEVPELFVEDLRAFAGEFG
ncbi:epoxide hydrolase [Natrinema pellirubrum DSM 15624]|uniref:Epoxide hydrolase n=1 Tax=Natrinema pellirubrum (strain DSM 15624 / CIP 106293 / JCM 10476 / NCIMB 786 / 157) TaxID=797303 RepID=L0JRL7_NATP1|nr:epoxide hydrolase [Natrinema pellirubrum]AGB33026.1 putative hydrolase or acyltransferase of alpha/beta superfamily [Natrinema pellirubrum DSM 15624]ELY75130.1 epoxide hydrolase [Natrinema pellirubrum DSM 15624]